MPSEETVVSELRAALLSSKTPLSLRDVNSDFRSINGYSIPFREFGHKSLEEFLNKLKDKGEITMEYERGHLMVHAIPKGTSAHVTHLINRQRTTNKKNNASQLPIDIPQNMLSFIPEQRNSPPSTENLSFTSLRPDSNFSSQVAKYLSAYSDLDNGGGSRLSSTGSNCVEDNRSPQELRNGNENLKPLSLFHDSYNLKLDTLPNHQRMLIENLISKINHQINYFSVDNKMQSNKIKLTCKLCCITLHLEKVEKHIQEQGHLRNLTKRCKSGCKSVAHTAVNEKNWDFLDFDASSQRYQCTLCKVNLPESKTSWNKHFQSGSHRTKLKAIKPEVPLNPISLTSGSKQTDTNPNSFKVITQILNDKEKEALEAVKRTLKDDIIYFEPSYKNVHGSGELFVICKICKSSLLPENVKSHVLTDGHLKGLEKNLSVVKCAPTERSIDSSKSLKSFSEVTEFLNAKDKKVLIAVQRVLKKTMKYFEPICETRRGSGKLYLICKVCDVRLHPKNVRLHIATDAHLGNVKENWPTVKCTSAQESYDSAKSLILPSPTPTDLNENLNSAAESVNLSSANLVQSLTDALKNSKINLEPSHDKESNRPCFTCTICSISFISKHAGLHVFSDSHLRNLSKSLSVAALETSAARNKKIAKDVIHQFNNRMYFFQLIHDNESNKLYFICKVCTKVLVPEDVENHIYSPEHPKNVQANPVVLDFHSLSDSNQCIVKDLATIIKNRIQDFAFVYRIGTDTLRFYCKYCQSIMIPEKVEDHITLRDHMKAMSKKASESHGLTENSNLQRKIMECDGQNNLTEPPNISRHSVHFNGVDFDSWSLEEILTHQNVSTSSFDAIKTIVGSVKFDFNSHSKYFDLLYSLDSKKCYFKCKLCDTYLKPAQVANHTQVGKHSKSLILDSYFDNFQSLDRQMVYILNRLFFKIGEKLNNFCLLQDSSSEKPLFKCKFCKVNLFSDFVVDHLQTEEHQKCTNEDNLRASSQPYEPKDNVDSDHMNSVSIKPSESHDIAEDSNLQRKMFKCDTQNNVTIPPELARPSLRFNGLDFDVWSMEEILTRQSFDAMKTIVGSVKCDFNSHSKYFDLLYSVDSKKCYFRCKVCDTYIRPAQVANHTQGGKHVKNLALNSYFENFKSLDSSTAYILTELFYKIGEKLNNYSLLSDSGSEKPQFKCKICEVTLFSDCVVNHLETEEHQKYADEDNLRTSSQFYEPKDNVDSDHMNTDESHDTAEDSNLQRKIFKCDAQNNLTFYRNIVRPSVCFNGIDFNVWSLEEILTHQSLSTSNFDAIKTIVGSVKCNFNVNSKYFDLLHSVDQKKFYFKCNLCNTFLRPVQVSSHTQVRRHVKNVALNSYFENFQSLDSSTVYILTGLFLEIGEKLNNYSLLSDSGSEQPQFKCKICEVTLSSDCVVNHLETEEHQKCINESRLCTKPNSRTSAQLLEAKKTVESEPIIHEIVENVTSSSVSSDISSSVTLISLKENTPNLNFDPARDSVEGVSRGKFAETTLPCAENCEVFESDALDRETPRTPLEADGLELGRTFSPPNLTASIENSSESKIDILSNDGRETLKTLIDKIGIQISHFDFMLKNSSDELRLKCKFCDVMMHPETAENHVKCGEHLKFLQLANMPNLRFESLDDSSKKLVRNLFNKIGTEINDFDVPFCMVCKICGTNVSPGNIVNHAKCEDHLKHLQGHSSGDIVGSDMCDAKNSQDCINDSIKMEKMTHKTFTHSNDHHSGPVKLHQSANDLSFQIAKSCNGDIEKKSCDKMTQTSGDIDSTTTATMGKFQSDSEIPRTGLLSTLRENIRVNRTEKHATAVIIDKTSHVAGGQTLPRI